MARIEAQTAELTEDITQAVVAAAGGKASVAAQPDALAAMAALLTPRRVQILRRLHREGATATNKLSVDLALSDDDLASDIALLMKAGLLRPSASGPYAPYDTILARIVL